MIQNNNAENPQHEKVHDEGPTVTDLDKSKKMNTVDALAVDLENRGAVKGDNSDGRVNWTFKQICATIALSGLYVGKILPSHVIKQKYYTILTITTDRISTSTFLRWRKPEVHRRRYWRSSNRGMVTDFTLSHACRSRSVLRLFARYFRAP